MKPGWHLNRWVCRNLWLLNLCGARLTITNLFRSPGDTLLTGTVCRIVKTRYPRLRINCRAEHWELLRHDPYIETFNAPPGRWHAEFEYLALIERKDPDTQVLAPTLAKLGMAGGGYRARVYLTEEERAAARARVGTPGRPIVTINTMSREEMKIWPAEHWRALIEMLADDFALIQLGDASEPGFARVTSFAGRLSMRESMAVLSLARVHIGPDSFLMHAANGLDIPGAIIFGGSRTERNLGYAGNENIFEAVDCGPCWLHSTKGERCGHAMKCMRQIGPERVRDAVRRLAAARGGASANL